MRDLVEAESTKGRDNLLRENVIPVVITSAMIDDRELYDLGILDGIPDRDILGVCHYDSTKISATVLSSLRGRWADDSRAKLHLRRALVHIPPSCRRAL